MNRRRFSHRMRIQVLGLFMLLGLGAVDAAALVGAGGARRGMDGEDPGQLGINRAHSLGAR